MPITFNKTRLFENFLIVIIICGIIVAMVGTHLQKIFINNNTIQQTISTGYITTILGILLFAPISIYFHKDLFVNPPGESIIGKMGNAINEFIFYPLPSTITIGVLIYILVITFAYKDQLIKHHVPKEYNQYSSLFTLLLIIQIISLIYYLTIKDNSTAKFSVFVLGALNLTLLGIMQTILQYFTTDG